MFQLNATNLYVSCLVLNRGIPTVPGTVCLKKDANNLIGISIGGGAQYCPCLYIVQVGTEQFITAACYKSMTGHFCHVSSLMMI